MSLFDALTRVGLRVESQLHLMNNNEDATIAVSVLPFIRALGYNTQDLSEVYPQYAILNMDAVDRAILRDGEPIMFLEAKNAGEKLGRKYWRQLFQYFNADKAHIGILTNGIEYRFYTDIDKKHIMDKEPFLVINLLGLDKVSVSHLEGLTKARFEPEFSLRKIKVSNLLERELRQPSDEFVRYFAKQIHSGTVWENVIEEFRPIVKQSWNELVGVMTPPEQKPPDGDPEIVDPPESCPHLPEPQTWLDGSVEIPVFATWKDHELQATLRLRGKISNLGNIVLWDRKWLNAKLAGDEARKTVDPNSQEYVTGMTFWHFRDPRDDRLRPIMDLLKGWYDDWELILRVIRNTSQ